MRPAPLYAAAGLLLVISNLATAETANVQTPAPVIHLSDNLDEADGLGWCIDTVGRGLSDRVHAHSCKPRGGDVQFRHDAETGQIRSVAFEDLCVRYEGGAILGLVACDGSAEQRFDYDPDAMTFHPAGMADLCLAVGAASDAAGPFMSRSLGFAECAQTPPELMTWVIRQ